MSHSAADSGPPAQQRGGRRRSWRWRVGAVGGFIGAGALFLTSAITADGQEIRAESVTDLATVVRQQRAETDQLLAQEEALKQEIAALSERVGGREVQQIQRRLDRLRPAAGLSDVSGEGLRVVLDDSPKDRIDAARETGRPDPEKLIVHQQDIQAVVNALWAGGARAISLMDRRVIATTGIKCVGSNVILHGRPYSPPYRIAAVGDPQKMLAALDSSAYVQGYLKVVRTYDLGWETEVDDEVDIPAYSGSTRLSLAKPFTGSEPERDD
ncbi:DUF881 domain-containing protein [Alteromonas gracilis]